MGSIAKMKKNEEEYLQIYVVSFLKKLQAAKDNFTFWHTPNSASRNRLEGGKFKLLGVLSGVPDLTILYNGGIRFVEFKKKNGSLSTEQKSFIGRAKGHGHITDIIYGDTVREYLDQISIIALSLGHDQKVISSISDKILSGLEKS